MFVSKFSKSGDVFVELFSPPWLLANQANGSAGRHCDRAGQGGRVNEGPRRLNQMLDPDRVAGHEGAEATDRFGERADHQNRSLRNHAMLFKRTLAVASEDAEAVGIIDQQQPVLIFRALLVQFHDRRDISIHAEHAIGRDQGFLIGLLLQDFGRVIVV